MPALGLWCCGRSAAGREIRIGLVNKLMSGVVRIKLDSESEDEDYGFPIAALAKGSRLRADVLWQLCAESRPSSSFAPFWPVIQRASAR
jgi:hypothetical protein